MEKLAQKYIKYESYLGCELLYLIYQKPEKTIFLPSLSSSSSSSSSCIFSFTLLVSLSLLICCGVHCYAHNPKNYVGRLVNTSKYWLNELFPESYGFLNVPSSIKLWEWHEGMSILQKLLSCRLDMGKPRYRKTC